MPLAKGIKKLFQRRSKPQSALSTVNKAGAAHSDRTGALPRGRVSTSSGTEVTTSTPSESEFYFPGRDPSSTHREESIVEEEEAGPKEEKTTAKTGTTDEPVIAAQASDGIMPSIGEKHTHFSHDRSESGGTDSSLDEVSPLISDRRHSHASHTTTGSDFNRDPPDVAASYAAIPLLEQTALPRGGISMDTKAVGRVQVSIYQ